jgi:hypothetical protein
MGVRDDVALAATPPDTLISSIASVTSAAVIVEEK